MNVDGRPTDGTERTLVIFTAQRNNGNGNGSYGTAQHDDGNQA